MNVKKSELERNLELAERRYEELFKELSDGMVDLSEADDVEVVFANHDDGWRLWVNVDGRNRLRIYRIKKIHWRDGNFPRNDR